MKRSAGKCAMCRLGCSIEALWGVLRNGTVTVIVMRNAGLGLS